MTAESQPLTWRPLTVSDAAALADLLNAVDAEDHVWGRYTVEDAADELTSPTVDLPTSTLAVFDGPTMLGFSAVHDKPATGDVHRMQAAGAVRPTHRRQGLGTTLLRHGLDTARMLHARHHPTRRPVVEAVYGDHVDGAVALYRAAAMSATQRNVHMRHPLGAATVVTPIPDGLRIEGWTTQTDEEFRAVRNDAFRTNGSARLTAEQWTSWVVNANRPAYRRRGVASALMSHVLRAAQDQGYGQASLRVTADGPSGGFGLARRAGFVAQDTQVHYCIEP